MNEDNFKVILEGALNPIKKQLKELDSIKQQLNDPETGLKIINEKLKDLDSIKVQLKELAPIKKDLNSVKQRLDDPKTGLSRINEKLDALWDQTVKLTEEAEETKEILKFQSKNLNKTNDNIVKVDKRLTKVENHLGVCAPPELSII